MKTLLFYDIETTGLNAAFDQILQFSAVRTDTNFRHLKNYDIRIRLRSDVIPSPYAIITNRISALQFTKGVSEFQGITAIHRIFNTPDTISIGYNTLGFDDEFLRFSFFRNFLSPYTHQYYNGCGRIDLLPIVVMYKLFSPDILKWKYTDDRPSLKLEHINEENNLAQGRAHDARVDVMMCVELARILSKQTEIWNYLTASFDKKTDCSRLSRIPQYFDADIGCFRIGLITGARFGYENQYQAPALNIGRSIPYSNQDLWLRLDIPELAETSEQTIDKTTWVVRKKFGEPEIILPLLKRFWDKINPEKRSVVMQNLKWIKTSPDLFGKIIEYHQSFRYPRVPNLDPDSSLYEIGFLSKTDELLCRRFHKMSFRKKNDFLSKFQIKELRELAGRLICRNYNARIPPSLSDNYYTYLKSVNSEIDELRPLDYKGQLRFSYKNAFAEIEQIRNEDNIDSEQLTILNELEAYMRRIINE